MKILEKLQKRLQEGKKDNKGFSLVELIIVIAIMAILIGIVGMNIIPQIENARQSKDKQVLSAYLTESVQALTQNAAICTSQKFTLTITVEEGATTSVACVGDPADTTGATAILNAFASLAGFGTLGTGGAIEDDNQTSFESNAGDAITAIVINLSLATGDDAASLTTTGSTLAPVGNVEFVSK